MIFFFNFFFYTLQPRGAVLAWAAQVTRRGPEVQPQVWAEGFSLRYTATNNVFEHTVSFCIRLFSELKSLWEKFLLYLPVLFSARSNVERQEAVILKDPELYWKSEAPRPDPQGYSAPNTWKCPITIGGTLNTQQGGKAMNT